MKNHMKSTAFAVSVLISLFSCDIQDTKEIENNEKEIIDNSYKRDLNNFDIVLLDGESHTMFDVLSDESLFTAYRDAQEFTISMENPRHLTISSTLSELPDTKSTTIFTKKGYTFFIKLFSGNNLDGVVRRVNVQNLRIRAGGTPYLTSLPEAASIGNNSAIVKFSKLQLCSGGKEGQVLVPWFNFFSTTGGAIGAERVYPDDLRIVRRREDFSNSGSFNEFNLNKFGCFEIQ